MGGRLSEGGGRGGGGGGEGGSVQGKEGNSTSQAVRGISRSVLPLVFRFAYKIEYPQEMEGGG